MPRFEGSHVPLPTPFRGDGLDLAALRRLVDLHLERRTAGLVPLGTTGETPTLTEREYGAVLETVLEEVAGRLPVTPGVGTNCTRSTVERARLAEGAGASAVLVVTPYYNRPGPEGLFRHFAAVAEAVAVPIVLYNVPSRTGVDLGPDVVARLAERFPHVAAVKEASTSLERVRELAAIEGIDVLCGEDPLIGRFVESGATGAVAVTANVLPDEIADWIATGEEVRHVPELARVLFVETNPVPLKFALARMELCDEDVRLPLTPLAPENRSVVEDALERAGLVPAKLSSRA